MVFASTMRMTWRRSSSVSKRSDRRRRVRENTAAPHQDVESPLVSLEVADERGRDAVFPALFPSEVSGYEVVKPFIVDEVLESPASSDVTDYQHTLPGPAQLEIVDETAHAHHGRPPRLATWVGRIEIHLPFCVHNRGGHPVVLAVVAFSEPPVMKNRDAATSALMQCHGIASPIRRR